jgi:hypothetical protein
MVSYLGSLCVVVCLATVGCGAVDDPASEATSSELSQPLIKDPRGGTSGGCTGAATDFMGPVINGHMEGSLCCGVAQCTDPEVCDDTLSYHTACVDCDYVACTTTKTPGSSTPWGGTPDLPNRLP